MEQAFSPFDCRKARKKLLNDQPRVDASLGGELISFSRTEQDLIVPGRGDQILKLVSPPERTSGRAGGF